MALEDFFTLTEMKDGLATVARVEELMSILQRQKQCTIYSIHDDAREWSTVARILAATENKNCLDCFIHLDGIRFLDCWLKHSIDLVASPLVETIGFIIGALQRLPYNREIFRKQLTNYGFGRSISKILALEKSDVKDSAKMLLDSWSSMNDKAENYEDEEEREPCFDDKLKDGTDLVEVVASPPSPLHDLSQREGYDRGSCDKDSAENCCNDLNDSRFTSLSKADSMKDVAVALPANAIQCATSNSGDANTNAGDSRTSTCQKNLSTSMEASGAPEGIVCTAMPCSPTPEEKNVVPHPLPLSGTTSMGSREMEVDVETKDESQLENSQKETLSFVQDSWKGTVQEGNHGTEKAESDQVEIHKPQGQSGTVDCGVQNFKGDLKELKFHKPDDIESSFHGVKVLEACKDTKKSERYLHAHKKRHPRHHHDAMKTMSNKGTNSATVINKIKPDIGLEYGDDALEVAVQVALEAKLEVADRERHSSSPDNSGDQMMDSGSTGSEESNQPESRKSRSKIDQSDSGDSQEEHSSNLSENSKISRDHEPTKTVSDEESQQKNVKSKCDFDLNEDVLCTEEVDNLPDPVSNNQNNLSAPVAVVPTSRGTLGLPVTPLQFEGGSGWKGSAATSAFRPASPRRTPDGEKTVSGPNQKAIFDLNVVVDENDVAIDPICEKQMPVSSGLPSGESSVEVTSAKEERLKLDLNHRVGDEVASLNPSSFWKFHGSPSPASSSNAKQSIMREIDLNDNPSLSDSFPNNKNRDVGNITIRGGLKLNDPVVTIMGSKLTIERKEPVSQTQLPFLTTGPGMEFATNVRPPAVCPQPPAAGCAYLPPAIYEAGSFPYTIDPRGASVIPQMLGSSVALHAPTSRPSFLANISGTQTGFGVEGPRGGLDLNTVSFSLDGGDKEIGNLKQFFVQEGNGMGEEHIRTASQAAPSSSMGIKRKEPDCGWETYPIGCKQMTSWQ